MIPGTPNIGTPFGKLGSGMGMVWEAYHKGVALLGVPENPIGSVLCIWGVAPILFMEEM